MKLHAPLGNFRANKVLITAKFCGVEIEQAAYDEAYIKSKEFAKISPFKTVPALETAEGNICESDAIIRFLARMRDSPLYNGSPQLLAEIDTWLDLNRQFEVAVCNWIYPILGLQAFDEEVHAASQAEIKKFLFILNDRLGRQPYIAAPTMTLADIAWATTLVLPYRLAFDEMFRKPLANLNRWFDGLVAMAEFTEVQGPMKLCVVALKAPEGKKKKDKKKKDKKKKKGDDEGSDDEGEKKKKKKDKKKKDSEDEGSDDEGEKKKKKKDKKKKKGSDDEGSEEEGEKKKKKKDKKKKSDDEEEEGEGKKEKKKKDKKKKGSDDEESKEESKDVEEEKPKKKQNPLELLPPSPMVLDEWKKLYANVKNKREVMSQFWERFDNEGWSIWILHYQKAEGEGEVLFKTNNLIGGFLQRLDSFRKYSFGTLGVYGDEPTLEIRGCFMWRGHEITQELLDHPSFEYYDREKVDINNPQQKATVEDYWCNDDEPMQVEGLTVREWRTFL